MSPGLARGLTALALAGVVAAALVGFRRQQELDRQVDRLARENAALAARLQQADARATALEKQAIALDNQLGQAKSRTTATESQHVRLSRELESTRSLLNEREQREVALMAELAALRAESAPGGPHPVTATNAVPGDPPAASPAVDVAPYERRIAELEERLTDLLTRALAEPGPAAPPEATPAAPPQVVRVGPADAFVVLDYGRARGARPGDVLTLRRDQDEIARVRISEARPRFSLAQVLPASLKGQLQPGDLVVLEN